jgi:biotin transport system substrate-specific component
MRESSWQRSVALIVLAVAFVAISARFDVPVPGSPVPQSLQTLAVVIVGAALGARRGALALLAYLVVGALGAPVFADGAAGIGSVVGPTGGYLAGFVAGASLMGWAVRTDRADPVRPSAAFERARAAFGRALAGGALAHLVILGLGWGRLSVLLGVGAAWSAGVAPFLVGGVAKSLLAALVWTGATWPKLRADGPT